MQNYINVLIEYIEYYLQFDGVQASLIDNIIHEKMSSLFELYYLAAYAQRNDIVSSLNDYFRTFGYTDEELIMPGADPSTMIDASTLDLN